MDVNTAYFILLVTSISLMLAQLFVDKQAVENIMFAIFCGSLAMVSVKALSAALMGPYQYLIGLGTCATCNVIWLVARGLFRGEQAIQARHIAVAVTIAMLVMLNQGLHFASATTLLPTDMASTFRNTIAEITQLLSSTILLLTFWEAVRPDARNGVLMPWQRYLFASAFISGLMLCTVGIRLISDSAMRADVYPFFVVFSALLILITTQALLVWKRRQNSHSDTRYKAQLLGDDTVKDAADANVAEGLMALLQEQKHFLTQNLKLVDVANTLGVSEYKVSRAIRYHFDAENFSQLVNQYRIEYAKTLMKETQNAHWSILVIGMESGFSSLSSFNRAFKSMQGCSPNTYRLRTRLSEKNNVTSSA